MSWKEIRTTEGITRFLRNQKCPISDVCTVSEKLLENDEPVALPDKERFIFELVCDRLGQTKNREYRTSREFWELFQKVWLAFDATESLKSTRIKCINRIRFNDLVVSMLSDVEFENDIEFLVIFVNSVNLVMNELRLSFSSDTNVEMVARLLDLALKTKQDSCTKLAYRLFKMANTTTLHYSKKNAAYFCAECLPSLLCLMNSNEAQLLEGMLREVLLRRDAIPDLKENIGFFCNSAYVKRIEGSSVAELFQRIAGRLAVSDVEQIYMEIVSKFPDVKVDLLRRIVAMNKVLSARFLTDLVESSNLNLEILQFAINKNVDVGLHYSSKIFELASTGFDEQKFQLLSTLLDVYAKAREIDEFFDLWLKNCHPKSVLISDQFVTQVSQVIVDLSQKQIIALIGKYVETFEDSEWNAVLLSAIAKCLLSSVTGSTHVAVTKTLQQTVQEAKPLFLRVLDRKVGNAHYWKLATMILMIYDVEPDLPSGELDEYYFAYLRLCERNLSHRNEAQVSQFINHYIKSDLSFKRVIFKRWFVLMNAMLDKQQLRTLVEEYLRVEREPVKVLSNGVLHEQINLVREIINYIVHHFSEDPENMARCTEQIPVYCYSRAQREHALDALVSVPSEASLASILMLLSQPTLRSKLESNLDVLITFVDLSDDHRRMDIAEKIFDAHLRQGSSFVCDAEKELQSKSLKTALCLLRAERKVGKLNAQLFEATVKRCVDSLSTDTRSLDFLVELKSWNREADPSIKPVIRELGANCDEVTSAKLFSLVCQLKNTYSPAYVLALYMNLKDSSEVIDSLRTYLRELGFEQISALWMWALESDELCSKLCSLIGLFLQIQTSGNQYAQRLAIASVSKLLDLQLSTKDMLYVAQVLKQVLSSSHWMLTQYTVELIITFVNRVTKQLLDFEGSPDDRQALFAQNCQLLSNVLLFQRFRFSNRQHLITLSFIPLMECLFKLKMDASAGLAYQRLVGNLCEISASSVTNAETESSLTSAISYMKFQLRKFASLLIMNYVKFYLIYRLDPATKEALEGSMFVIFDLLTINELNYINLSLDSQARVVYKTLFDDYKKFGKWREE
ncbi:hypothetical protein KL910_005139 [Ogataea haglerorum]|uniref:Nucleolar 27S pre-rRNA processing Urb2/Npa2 C-terminal domain-containing protein n=1 Tax=Ogataea haglerorum TaxID=1937702 RepID=A0ABQ7RA55_9ASCO|nr:hypothetical protein KL947_005043 [Ogataea haglerorum]KAG7762063.1 hypothetical protein KL946_004927 [Ogataea haglerorum]KAG7783758.1 hypothetical protein KL945_004892 [Ogataea haglerorum]KAG7784526.1 hypothetical protein KL910_005139 [Ogataea haglerorum]